jgi:hypothetical protein
MRLPYATTKISLNNSGIESITITDSWGVILDSYEYSGTQKDDIVIQIASTDENCEILPPIDTNTGTVSTGSTDTGSTNTGTSNSGSTDTGTDHSGSVVGTGTTSTGGEQPHGDVFWSGGTSSGNTIDTGSVNSGSTTTIILFPEIYPTLQFPSNAIFSGSIFDCTGQSPCRINMTLDLIFTGWVLAWDYTCEVISSSGTLSTCNPNTIYFSTGGLITFRLTSKIDPTQSMSMTWPVIFANIDTGSGSGPSDIPGWWGTGSTDSGSSNTGSIDSDITFPEITPIFQNYTNTSHSGDILICTTSPCRVNFTLESIFTGAFQSSQYSCEIHYGTGIYNTCNPPQLYPTWTGSIDITLTHKLSWEKNIKSIQIIQSIRVDSQGSTLNSPPTIDTTPPILILEYDGKLKSYHDQISEYEMNCYTSTCTINLTAEKSYDSEWSELSFLWYYWPNDIKTTRDPGDRKYWIWDHQIWLRIIDANGNTSQVRYNIHVLGEWEKLEKNLTEWQKKKEKMSKNSHIQTPKTKEKSRIKKKIKKMTFFDPPRVELQNSKFKLENNEYVCYTKSKNCSLNLILSGSQKWMVYTWIYDNAEIIESKNPKSKSLTPGVHMVRLIAGYSSDVPIWSQDIRVTVIQTQKPKKQKKAKISKIGYNKWSITQSESQNTQINTPIEEQKNTDTIPYTAMALIGGIVPLLIIRKRIASLIRKI